MPTILHLSRTERHQRIVAARSLDALLDEPDGRDVLRAEASDPDEEGRLITHDQLDHLLAVRAERARRGPRLGLFFSTDDVILVPGFMGSTLTDLGEHGLIWIDPLLVIDGDQLSALRLAAFDADGPDPDAGGGVRIESRGPVPAIYDLLRM